MSTRTSISTGSGSLLETIERLSVSYPFVRQECCQFQILYHIQLNYMLILLLQVDIVLPSDSIILQALKELKTSYLHGRTTLSNIIDCSYSLTDKFAVSRYAASPSNWSPMLT